ncbi:MAG: TIGR02757 family protein [Marinilabiliales bacterium]|nr:MAG: TIGR02757 family protein [Marinilabiliales bacterium]
MTSPEERELKEFLEEKTRQYNQADFIETDPVSIPHSFTCEYDIEISALLAATIAWGQRKTIIRNARQMMELMGNRPHDFIMNYSESDLLPLMNFRHRTFNGEDLVFFVRALNNIYSNHGGLKKVFTSQYAEGGSVFDAICGFRDLFLSVPGPRRTSKHISNPEAGSPAKRINMFLRWMVRRDSNGVDFGIWKDMDQKALRIPLDVHTGNISRKLSLLKRKQNDWKAVEELTGVLRNFDPADPVKYDFALFGLGVFEKF